MKLKFTAVLSLFLTALSVTMSGQVRPVYDNGALGLERTLRRLNTSGSVLMIGAHPDDEDTALLSYIARGENARTAYLSLTRGDGGQNIIGPELGESLGVIRTEELLQARRLDGAEQYFTRAYDYGFSKTLAEAKQKWDERIILCDAVRVIREFRPLVVISHFNGTPADGHGQHQFAGYLSPLAVNAAGDPGQCNGTGEVWKVRKFYIRHRGDGEPTLRINTGKYDWLLGRSYFQVAMEARSQHKSQEQGVLELKGDQFSSIDLKGGTSNETGIFDSLDVSLRGIAANTNNAETALSEALARLQRISADSLKQYDRDSPGKILPLLLDGYELVASLIRSSRNASTRAYLEQKHSEFTIAIRCAAGIQIDALSENETVVAGEEFPVHLRVYAPPAIQFAVRDVDLLSNSGARIMPTDAPPETSSPPARRERPNYYAFFKASIINLAITQPYWLEKPRDGDLFRWTNEPSQTRSFRPPVMVARLKLTILGREVEFSAPVEYRFADDIRGEVRRELNVVPAITIELDQELLIVPTRNESSTRRVVASVVNNSPESQSGRISLDIGGIARSASGTYSKDFVLVRRGQRASFIFDVVIPANTPAGKYELTARASTKQGGIDPTVYSYRMITVAYPHIYTHRIYRQAKSDIRVLPIAVAPVRVGYIAGTGDRVADAIRQLGLSVEMLGENDLASSDLSRFDVIMVGIRAYQVRPAVVANNQRLLDFTKNGGTLVVQYQLPTFAIQNLLPFAAQLGPRVSDENAQVNILRADHPIFNSPNKITQEDFRDWVQERNLYNFSKYDPAYVPLLESHDAGEPVNDGGLVTADLGKGKYVYCSYSLFRQLPAGVPGAYRLLANILSYGTKPS